MIIYSMKSIIISFFLTIVFYSTSLGYGVLNDTSQFIDDLKLINSNSWDITDDIILNTRQTRVLNYLIGVRSAKENAVQALFTKKAEAVGRPPLTIEDYQNSLNKTENELYGYILPTSASYKVIGKVIIKYADDYPELLILPPIMFMEFALKDAWGVK